MKLNYCDFPFNRCHAAWWKPAGNHAAMVYWFGPHVCFHICLCSTVNKPPIYPLKCRVFHSLPSVRWRKVLIKIQPENIPVISHTHTPLARPWNQQMDCFDVLASFTLFLFSHQEIILVWQVGRRWKITTIPVLRALAWPISILMEI